MAPNYSLHAIPVYWILALLPHAYAVSYMKKANNGKWNNANPRGTGETNKRAVPAAVQAKFERMEASHANSMENAPFFIGAILAGNQAGLSSDTMNTAAGLFLALRVLYLFAYANIARTRYSYVRSLLWALSMAVLIRLYWAAGDKLIA
ncbi:hypothetical protein DM02DRAFT_609811 [Periconia macrospinosa]|uniref:Membrane-associated proteins in eicosanoid and glutathione metabolism n=1 Tax=Periconia macrospinosa TaxID=97972 RepID=A0A2V1E7Y9_9PLEO|nr:hypothetical protein DM02DRAFT_609811 [Periconia macrospinosa]